MNGRERSAASQGLIGCEACALLVRPVHADEPGHCPRCGAELEFRRARSVQTTWALVIAAAVCYLPANMLPVMVSSTLAGDEDDTILSGVIYLYTSGSWPLALIVLVASVMVPIGKLLALGYVLVSIQAGKAVGQLERTRLFRIVHIIGKWSMLDVFVVTFTVALVQLKPLMAVMPGEGVLFFAAVVVLTMIAAESLDPRLIWDDEQTEQGHHG
jgi:paraquat-inducible protein A